MFCPCKQHPLGNEYLTVHCGVSGIMFIMEMIEGKDRLWELGNPEIDDSGGNHANLLLHL